MRTILNSKTLLQASYNKTNFKNIITGTSDCNDYIPVYAISNHELISFKDTDINVIEYSMPISTNIHNYVRQYDQVISRLKETILPYRYLFRLAGVQHELYINRGLLYDAQGNILMVLAINKEYLLSLPKKAFEEESLDSNQFVLFLSQEFDNPNYKNVKKKIEVMYINEVKNLGIDIIISNKINSWIFKNNVKPMKFKSVIKLNKHLKEEVPMQILEI